MNRDGKEENPASIPCLLRMLKNAHDAVTIRYGATRVQADSATTASRSPTNVHDSAVFM